MVSSAGGVSVKVKEMIRQSLSTLRLEMDFRDSCYYCALGSFYSASMCELVFLSFNTARERILIYERAVFFISIS